MRVALHHRERLVSENLGDLEERCSGHGKVARRGVPEIVEAEVFQSSPLSREFPCRPVAALPEHLAGARRPQAPESLSSKDGLSRSPVTFARSEDFWRQLWKKCRNGATLKSEGPSRADGSTPLTQRTCKEAR